MTNETPKRRGFVHGQFYSRADRHARKMAFLNALVEGHSIIEAAERVKVPWRTLYSWRKEDHAFREAWNEARRRAADAYRTYPLPPIPRPAPPKPTITVREFDEPEDERG